MRVKAAYLVGLLLSFLVMGLLVAAAASPWYNWDDLKGGSVTEYPTSSKAYGDCIYTNSMCGFGKDWKLMYNIIFIFIMISLALDTTISVVFFAYSFSWFGKQGWLLRLKIPLVLASLSLLATTTVAWGMLFRHASAVNDFFQWDCSSDGNVPYCSFLGSNGPVSWGPTFGWGFALGTTAVTLPIVLIAIFGGVPASDYDGLSLSPED